MGNYFRELHSALAVVPEGEGTSHQDVLVGELERFDALGVWFPAALCQLGLRVEELHLAWPAVLHQLDHRLGGSGEMARSRSKIGVRRPRRLTGK